MSINALKASIVTLVECAAPESRTCANFVTKIRDLLVGLTIIMSSIMENVLRTTVRSSIHRVSMTLLSDIQVRI